VIWYQAPEVLDATTLFIRLNVGRIPLTDAELVKALLLSRSRGRTGVTDRALEIAAQWDAIERDLREPELWSFITGKASEDPTHISLLLDTIAEDPRTSTATSPPRARALPSSGSQQQWAGENVCRCYTRCYILASRQERGRLGFLRNGL
jgi:hypothetical protein